MALLVVGGEKKRSAVLWSSFAFPIPASAQSSPTHVQFEARCRTKVGVRGHPVAVSRRYLRFNSTLPVKGSKDRRSAPTTA